jgi:hypothetical protein
MRKALAASVAIVLSAGSTYAWSRRPAEKIPAAPQESPRVETASLFAAGRDMSPPPASDLIAIKLAIQPVIWPDAPKPQAAVKINSPAPTLKKPVPAKKLKVTKPTTGAASAHTAR